MTNEINKANAQALLDAATPGEWYKGNDEDCSKSLVLANTPEGDDLIICECYDNNILPAEANAALIEAAPLYLQAYIEQCDHVDALEGQIEELNETVLAYRNRLAASEKLLKGRVERLEIYHQCTWIVLKDVVHSYKITGALRSVLEGIISDINDVVAKGADHDH